jgi:hypothetical protein
VRSLPTTPQDRPCGRQNKQNNGPHSDERWVASQVAPVRDAAYEHSRLLGRSGG